MSCGSNNPVAGKKGPQLEVATRNLRHSLYSRYLGRVCRLELIRSFELVGLRGRWRLTSTLPWRCTPVILSGVHCRRGTPGRSPCGGYLCAMPFRISSRHSLNNFSYHMATFATDIDCMIRFKIRTPSVLQLTRSINMSSWQIACVSVPGPSIFVCPFSSRAMASCRAQLASWARIKDQYPIKSCHLAQERPQ